MNDPSLDAGPEAAAERDPISPGPRRPEREQGSEQRGEQGGDHGPTPTGAAGCLTVGAQVRERTGGPEGDADRGADRPAARAPRIRASTAERQAVIDALHAALSEGRLDLDEADSRVTAAYSTRFRDDLPLLLADLPVDGPCPCGSPHAGGWAALWIEVVRQARLECFDAQQADQTPTPRQSRTAAFLLVAALVWTVLWLFIGFAAVVM